MVVLGFVHPLAYRAPALRAVVETGMTLLVLAAAALIADQFQHTRRLRKLLVFSALLVLGLTELVARSLPAALQLHSSSGLAPAFPLGQLMAAVLLVVAGHIKSDRLVLQPRRPVLTIALVSVGAVAVAEGAGWLLRGQLLSGASSGPGSHHTMNHPLDVVLLISTAALFAWAAVGLARTSRFETRVLFLLLGESAFLLAAAQLHSLVVPRTSPVEVSLSETLRLLAFGFIFFGALSGDLEMRAAEMRAAAVAERRRVARDLHDGLAQDLAFIAAHGSQMAERLGDEHPVLRAARHALAMSRETISELSDAKSHSPREALDAIAHELGDRFGIRIVVDAAYNVDLPAEMRVEVGRIAREAIANAARHGAARHVLIALKQIDGVAVLRVSDDGRGIPDNFGAGDEGFGIGSMRDRAAALGGTLMLRRARTHGTELEVTFP